MALKSLADDRAPFFWTLVGDDMLEVFKESFKSELLPPSCRRAFVNLQNRENAGAEALEP